LSHALQVSAFYFVIYLIILTIVIIINVFTSVVKVPEGFKMK